LRPAAAFCALVPPWLEFDLVLPLPEALPPFLDEFGSLAIAAPPRHEEWARDPIIASRRILVSRARRLSAEQT
jgi:hypothetical protein